jgi:phage I-like protein
MVAAVRRTVDRAAPQAAAQTARSRAADQASVPADMVAAMMAERWAERAVAEDRERVAKVESAFREGYLTPAMKDWALALCRSDEAAFDTFVAKAGPVFATLSQRIGSAAPPAHLTGGAADDPTRRTDAAALIAAQLGLKPGALD